MRILLIGEFSGVHNNLKDGLEQLGHKVLLVSDNGDSFKKFSYDLDIGCNFENNFYGKVCKVIKEYTFFHLIKKYDIIQFIHPGVLRTAGYPERYIINILREMKKRGKLLFVLACGCDALYSNFCKYNKKYPCPDCEKTDSRRHSCVTKYDKIYKKYDITFMRNIDKIVTCAYDYDLIYRKYKTLFIDKLSSSMIPLPVNTDKFKRYYNLLIKWMQMREEKILLEDCFVNKQYYRVIIYGIGEIGELVYKELRKSEKISVVCGIDQNSNLYLEGLEIKGIDDIPINADVIVVTPVFAFEEIQEILRKKTNLNIVSLEEIISV